MVEPDRLNGGEWRDVDVWHCECGATGDNIQREVLDDGVCDCCGHYDDCAVEYGDNVCGVCGKRNPATVKKTERQFFTASDLLSMRMTQYYEARMLQTLTGWLKLGTPW